MAGSNAYEAVHRGDRAIGMFNAVVGQTGNAGRCHWYQVNDSTGEVQADNNNGRGQDTVDQPNGHPYATALVLQEYGFTIWGLPMGNMGTNQFNAQNALGGLINIQNFTTNPASAAAALLAGRSFPFTSAGSITAVSVANPTHLTTGAAHGLVTGDLITISGTNTSATTVGTFAVTVLDTTHFTIPVNVASVTSGTGTFTTNVSTFGYLGYVDGSGPYPAAVTFSDVAELAAADQYVTNSWRINPYILGDPKSVTVRLAFSYATNSTVAAWVAVTKFAGAALGSQNITANTAKVMVDTSIPVLADASTQARGAMLYDYGQYVNAAGPGTTNGPILFSGFQWTLASIDPTVSTSGPGGFAVTCLWRHGGLSLTKCNAEFYAYDVRALTEVFRAGGRSADWTIYDLRLAGHDAEAGSNAYVPGDPTTADATNYAGGSGPAQNTAAGWKQNLASHCALIEQAYLATGRSLSKLIILLNFYHTESGEPYKTTLPLLEQASCDWVDSGAPHSSRVVVMRGSRIAPAATILALNGYNAATKSITSASSVANPTVVTSTAHGMSNGQLVQFSATDSTPRLEGPYRIAGVTTNTFTVPVNVTSGGTAVGKFAVMNIDQAHLQSEMFMAFNALGIEALISVTAGINTVSPTPIPASGLFVPMRNRNQ